MHHPHYEQHIPSFCKRYAKLGTVINEALEKYRDEVKSGAFPTEEYSPYKMSKNELVKFNELLALDDVERKEKSKIVEKRLLENDEYERTKLY